VRPQLDLAWAEKVVENSSAVIKLVWSTLKIIRVFLFILRDHQKIFKLLSVKLVAY
jgi:hypothetical protein